MILNWKPPKTIDTDIGLLPGQELILRIVPNLEGGHMAHLRIEEKNEHGEIIGHETTIASVKSQTLKSSVTTEHPRPPDISLYQRPILAIEAAKYTFDLTFEITEGSNIYGLPR